MNNIFISFLLIIGILFPYYSAAAEDVCITEKDTVDLITLLDSSERDIVVKDSCQKLVKDLYSELDSKDQKLETLTKELVTSKQDVIKYRAANSTWKTWALVTTTSTALLLAIQIAPAL
jgi:hypothetical protein